MKTILITILIISMGIGIPIYLYKPPQTAELSVLRDVTEEHLAQPKAEEIISQFRLSESQWNGAIFRFVNISDISYSLILETKIDPANQWLSNEIERKKEIEKFNKGIEDILIQSKNDSIGRNHSSVYLPISSELRRLSESKSQKRMLILYSDLLENNLDVSLYSKGKVMVSELNEDSLNTIFEQGRPLPDLTGIEVYLIFQPTDVQKDKEFRIVSEFYRKLLVSKGAKVVIGGNLQN